MKFTSSCETKQITICATAAETGPVVLPLLKTAIQSHGQSKFVWIKTKQHKNSYFKSTTSNFSPDPLAVRLCVLKDAATNAVTCEFAMNALFLKNMNEFGLHS